MTIESAISAGFGAVSTGIRALHSLVSGSSKGDLSALTTINKTSMLAALNEVKARSSIGYRYSYNMTAQPRETWVQASGLTQVINTAGTQVTQSNGSFTFAASTIANVAGNWLFYGSAEAQVAADRPVAIEIRVNGTAIARQAVGGVSTTMGINTRAHVAVPYPIAGGEVITYYFMFDYTPLLGATTSTVVGVVGGAPI